MADRARYNPLTDDNREQILALAVAYGWDADEALNYVVTCGLAVLRARGELKKTKEENL